MAKRMTLMLIAVAIFIAAIGTVKFKQIQTAIAEGAAFQPPPEAVTTLVVAQESWDESLSAIGTVTAAQGVTVSADLPGIVEDITFDSGKAVRRGEVLVKLDARQEEAQLKAAEAQRDLRRLQLKRLQDLRAKGVTSQAESDSAEAEFTQAEARVGEIRAALDRKTIRAPFSGILGIRQVNLGQYLDAGDPVVPLQALNPVHVDFSVPQQQVVHLQVGTEIEVSAEGLVGGPVSGEVTALDSIVDVATRNIQIRSTFDNREGRLRPGMFVEVRAVLGAGQELVALPASSISYAPFGDSVFIVEQLEGPNGGSYLGVRQQFVRLGAARGDQVAVLSGVEPGAEVVTSGVFKLRNGVAVLVNNEVQPANDPAPRPENS